MAKIPRSSKSVQMAQISKWSKIQSGPKLLRYLNNCQICQPKYSEFENGKSGSKWPKRIRFQNDLNCQISPTRAKF